MSYHGKWPVRTHWDKETLLQSKKKVPKVTVTLTFELETIQCHRMISYVKNL